MFDDFYGLKGKPFQLTPDPAFYFESLTHRKALSYLGYGMAQGEGFVVVHGRQNAGEATGEHGFTRARWPGHEQAMTASGGYFQATYLAVCEL